jgi:hypothetical protein
MTKVGPLKRMAQQSARVIGAEYLEFSDGAEKIVDFSRWLDGEVFRPLNDKRKFKRFFISGGAVCWPNGADIAPETLRSAEDAT